MNRIKFKFVPAGSREGLFLLYKFKIKRYTFNVLKKGGILILGFPTPTFLYKITRKTSELLGLWIFHDERPLSIDEVLADVRERQATACRRFGQESEGRLDAGLGQILGDCLPDEEGFRVGRVAM